MIITALKQIMLSLAVILTAVSCSNPTAADEHIDAEGFVLENESGDEVYKEFKGEITGNITISVDDTLALSVHFLDNDGNEIEHAEDEDGEENELEFTDFDANIISIELEEHESGFELVGLSSGTTSFVLSLMHEGHSDYTSQPISVTVEQVK